MSRRVVIRNTSSTTTNTNKNDIDEEEEEEAAMSIGEDVDEMDMINGRRQWRSYMSRMAGHDTTCRTVMIFGFFMVILAGGLIAISLFSIRTSFESTHVVIGPRGPMGECNLSHVNQTFLIEGNTIIGSNLTINDTLFVGNELNVGDSLNIYETSSCVVFNTSNKPLCLTNCLKTNCISSSTSGGNITFNDPIVASQGGFFDDTLFVNDTLNIGGASFHWNGSMLIFTGPSNLGGLVNIPLSVGSSGTIGQNGTCMSFDATQCIIFDGQVTFLNPIQGPLSINGSLMIDPTLYVHNTSTGLQWNGTSFNLFASNSNLNLISPTMITLNSPTTNITGNLSLGGTVTNLLKLSQSGLQTTCLPGPQIGSLQFSPGCGCLTLSSTSGICLNASGTQGINVNGGGNFTINGPSMNLNFAGGSSIGTSVIVKGNLSTTGNVNVGGNLAVNGSISYTTLNITGASYFGGPITATSESNYFTGLTVDALTTNVTVSNFLTTFNGLGAIFPSGTGLQIASDIVISSLPSQVMCSSPIFYPDTPSTPNDSPCVEECTDMQRCSPTVANHKVVGNLNVGDDYTTTIIGNATFGILSSKAMALFTVNAGTIKLQSSSSVKVLASLDVTGSILQGGSTHPCCNGIGGSQQWLIVEISAVTASIATSEVTRVPFNLIQTPSSLLAIDFNTATSTFTATTSAMYSITVYLSMASAQYTLGTFRGVTLRKSFSFPTSTAVPIRICSQSTTFTAAPTPFQITCSYNAVFQAGDTFYVTAYYNFVGALTLNGASSVVSKPTTRLEIYRF